ncbi:Kelch repeat-containing protein [Zemynaea arenosa]|nr:kelch repeat-containing protein [Massilia arenosa]
MNRRELLRALAALGLPGSLAACGGGGQDSAAPGVPGSAPVISAFTADKAAYFVGDAPVVTATFSGGTGRIDPGNIAIASGTPLTLPSLSSTTTFRLTVGSATRDLALPVAYRNSFRTIPMGFARASHVAVTGTDGRVLILGGEGQGGMPPLDVMAFAPATETFVRAGALTTGRFSHTATVLADGTVLVVGGSRTVSGTTIAELFDPRTGQARATAGQPAVQRSRHTATRLADGRVLIAGGLTPGGNVGSDTVELYDPATQQFTRLNLRLQATRYAHVAVPLTANLVLLYGGATVGGAAVRPEVVDVVAQSSDLLNPPFDTTPRLGASLVKRSTGDYTTLGGEDALDGRPLAATANIAVGGISIQPGAPLSTARTMHASAALSDGRVLVTGGNDTLAYHPLASTELYGPTSTTTVAGPNLAAARLLHTATALPTGKVLVVGGLDPDRVALSTAEIYS